MNATIRCDICSVEIPPGDGYQLTTAQVVQSPRFWQAYFDLHAIEFAQAGLANYSELLTSPLRDPVTLQVAQSETPWLVCERCINLFDVEVGVVRENAHRWWEGGGRYIPPGSGPVGLEAVRMQPSEQVGAFVQSSVVPATEVTLLPVQDSEPGALEARLGERIPGVSEEEIVEPEPELPAPTFAPPSPRRPPRPPKGKPRWPLACALLNLSGLGLGFFYMRHWLGIIFLLGTLGILTSAYIAQAASAPLFWAGLMGGWLLFSGLVAFVHAWRVVRYARQIQAQAEEIPAEGNIIVESLVTGGAPELAVDGMAAGKADGMADGKAAGMAAGRLLEGAQEVEGAGELIQDDRSSKEAPIEEEGLRSIVEGGHPEEYFPARETGGVEGFRERVDIQADSMPGFRSWRALLGGVILLVLEAIAIWGYLTLGQREYDAGLAAYREADCLAANAHFQTVTTFYELTLSPNVAKADALSIECSLLIYTAGIWQAGDHDRAVHAYAAFQDLHPRSELYQHARRRAAEVYEQWAAEQKAQGDYQAAADTLRILEESYPDTEPGMRASSLAGQVYTAWGDWLEEKGEHEAALAAYRRMFEVDPQSANRAQVEAQAAEALNTWAAELLEQDQYAGAVDKYQQILDRYASTPAGESAAESAAQTCSQWSEARLAAGDYPGAIEPLLTILAHYPATSLAQGMEEKIAATYAAWAQALAAQGQMSEAIDKYLIAGGYYPQTETGHDARARVASLYIDWAAQLRQVNDFSQALVQYRVIIDHYRETASASLAPDLAAETYLDWASSLVQAGSFQDGIDRCQAVLVQYPDSKWIDQAAAAIPSFYFMWGDDLQHAGEYAEALERYEILLSEYPAAPVYSDTLLAVGQTYLDWGAELRSMRKFLDAMQKYTAAKDVLDDPEIISAAEDGYQGALWDLSQDSSGEGRLVLEEGIRVACSGEAAISPAIALDTESPGQARMCNEDFTLPQEMVAVKPASFRYAITTESGSSEIQNCPYTYQGCYGWSCPTTGTIIRQRLWVNVEVRDTLTGRVIYTQKFNGTNPEACPQTYYFWTTTEYFIGSEPDYADIIAWLEQVLR